MRTAQPQMMTSCQSGLLVSEVSGEKMFVEMVLKRTSEESM